MSSKKSLSNKRTSSVPKRTVQRNSEKTKAIDRFFAHHSGTDIWLSGLLPVVGLLIIYMCMGITPFGDKSVANVDMLQQYVPFYASLKIAVFGGGGLTYSSSLGMGGSYWGLIGYYLTSPFAWLSQLVPNDRLLDYMAVQELIKVGLAGMSFAYFYRSKFSRRDVTVPLAAVCYALSSFFLLHLSTIIWSDCLVLLPLIVWGLEELLRGKKPWLYILCLSAAGISNYYFAMMIGIYLVLYAAAFLFTEGFFSDVKKLLCKSAMFAASSLLSVGVSAGILLPSALVLGEYSRSGEEISSGFWSASPAAILSQMLYHADSRILSEGSLPLLYCSVLTVVCLPLFFFCRKISAQVRISFGALSGFLMLSLGVNGLNYLWHGAHVPNKLPFRFAFLLVFTLLVMAGYVLKQLDDLPTNAFIYVLLGMIAAVPLLWILDGMNNPVMLVGTLLLAAGYTVVFFLRAEKKMRSSSALALVLLLTFAEQTSGGVNAWRSLSSEAPYTARKECVTYLHNIEETAAAIKNLAVSDSDVYRVGTLLGSSLNDNVTLGQGGLSYFSSTNNGALMKMLHSVGYNSDRVASYYYKSFTPLMDSVLNVSYVVYPQSVGDPPYLQPLQDGAAGYSIYRNTLVLPRAFAVSDSLIGWNVSRDNPFVVQNEFVRKAVSDSDLTVYQPLELSLDETQSIGATYTDGRVKIPQSGRLVLRAVSAQRRHLYVYVNCEGASEISLCVGERQYSLHDTEAYVTDLGWWEPGESFTISVASARPVDGNIYAALLDENTLESGISRMAQAPAVFTAYTGTRVACEIEVEKGRMLFTSIPYEKGWHVTVNGKPTDTVPIGGGLIGIPLTEGHNAVELRYAVRGLTAGMMLSLVSVAAAVWLLFGKELSVRLRAIKKA